MADILTLAKKMERALRNGTGFKVSDEEIPILMQLGVFDTIGAEKIKELQARCLAKGNTQTEIIGSTSDATASRPTSGKSQPIDRKLGRSFIAALSAAA